MNKQQFREAYSFLRANTSCSPEHAHNKAECVWEHFEVARMVYASRDDNELAKRLPGAVAHAAAIENGGWLDGILGVCTAKDRLANARFLLRKNSSLVHPII